MEKIACTCVHPYQDSTLGKGIRYHNEMVPDSSGRKFRCTVCGTVHDIHGNVASKAKKA